MSANTISAVTTPPSTSVISTAARPAAKAPISGMNAPRKVSSMSGTTSGTPRITRPAPIIVASAAPTSTSPRT